MCYEKSAIFEIIEPAFFHKMSSFWDFWMDTAVGNYAETGENEKRKKIKHVDQGQYQGWETEPFRLFLNELRKSFPFEFLFF